MADCGADYYNYGGTDDSKFGKPLPWIGLYIAAASLACLALMSVDYYRSMKWKKPWVGSEFFALNATTIALLAVATKLPSDITGAMTGLFDQLTKLSGLIFLCVAMEHALPSLGVMDGLAALSNLTALGIIVVSTFVDIWIQLNSGVISNYYFRSIYVYYSLNMLLLFLILVTYAPFLSPSRKILYKQYYKLHERILKETSDEVDAGVRFSYDNLRGYVTRYWLMAVTSSQVYTLNTSRLRTAVSYLNAYPIVVILVCGTFLVSSKLRNGNKLRCFVRSDYSWSTWLIFSIQVLTIAAGCAKSILRIVRSMFHREWIREIKIGIYMSITFKKGLNDTPLIVWISNKRIRRAAYFFKRMLVAAFTVMLILVMLTCTVIVIIHSCLLEIMIICQRPVICINDIISKRCSVVVHDGTTKEDVADMSEYVLYLDAKKNDKQSKKTARHLQKYPTMWIDHGGANQPTNLDNHLRNASLPEAFGALYEFYSKQIPPAESSRQPLNCWALHIVTLARILYATSPGDRERLMLVVGESLRYIRLVDEILDEQGTTKMQEAAKTFWGKFYHHHHHQLNNVDFDRTESTIFSDIITALHEKAREETNQDEQCNSWKYWHQETFITNCMYTTTEIILRKQTERSPTNLPWSVEILEKVMVGLLGACLTNLPLAIFRHCSSGTFGLREEKVREAATVLGETREIIKLLEDTDLVVDYPENSKEYFESWCELSPSPQSPV